MGLLSKETFICLDCESTGLDTDKDRVIEIAAVKFTLEKHLDQTESLVDPQMVIPEESIAIHHITDKMVQGKPLIKELLPDFLEFVGRHTIMGHGIQYDIDILTSEAKRHNIPCKLKSNLIIDTLRLARLYGDSPINSLEALRKHFNVLAEGAHRAMNDVIVNIEVFKRLIEKFKTTKQLFDRLAKPIAMRAMPLGKHKGRPFRDIPLQYLQWAANKDFDQDLLYSIRSELKKRKKGGTFSQASNPFSSL
ncbi:Uncharacterized protein SCG7109_AD_00250 [Chlamydiales bacterium SCGC AG-110-M15]|nr:Uncharacterized protein SCG7109_AD_00250 [Chlamydiales bacterium SCGC AG-110-M15]